MLIVLTFEQTPRTSVMRTSNNVNRPSGSSRICQCDTEAVLKTTEREGANKGRRYWTCPNPPKDKCAYFDWEDGVGITAETARKAVSDGCFKVCLFVIVVWDLAHVFFSVDNPVTGQMVRGLVLYK